MLISLVFWHNNAIQEVPSACSRWPPGGSAALRSKTPMLSRCCSRKMKRTWSGSLERQMKLHTRLAIPTQHRRRNIDIVSQVQYAKPPAIADGDFDQDVLWNLLSIFHED